MRAVRRARRSQLLASASEMRCTAHPLQESRPRPPLSLCPPAHAAGPVLCHLRPCPHRRCPHSSRVLAHVPGCAPVRQPHSAPPHALRGRPLRRPARVPGSAPGCCRVRPCPSRALALSLRSVPRRGVRCSCSAPLRCRLPWRLARALALATCRLRPGRSPALVLGYSPCLLLTLPPRSRGRHPATPAPPPPSRITRRASCCRRSCGSVMLTGVRTGAGGQTGRGLPSGKAAFWGYGLWGLAWVWLGLVWTRYLAPSLPPAAAAAAPGEALGARAEAAPCAGGVRRALA